MTGGAAVGLGVIIALILAVGLILGMMLAKVAVAALELLRGPQHHSKTSLDSPRTLEEFVEVLTSGGMDLSNVSPEHLLRLWKAENDRRTGVTQKRVRQGNERILAQAKELLKDGME